MSNAEHQPTKLTNEMLLGEDYLDKPRMSFGVPMTLRDAEDLDRQRALIAEAMQRARQRKYGSIAIIQEGENDG